MNLFDTWRERRTIRRTHRQLNQLSDKILADIGLSRTDIASFADIARLRGRDIS